MKTISNEPASSVAEAIATRISVRAFRPDPVPVETVARLLERAARAPSGGNLQPWKVTVLTGAARDGLVAAVKAEIARDPAKAEHGQGTEYAVYPPNLTDPYRTRRRVLGQAMFDRLGVTRENKAGKLAHRARNFEFFGAPVGLFVTIDRQMQVGQFADLGLFLGTLTLLARTEGLHTCLQEAWAEWHLLLNEYLPVPPNEMVFCGVALGFADEEAPVNGLVSERAPLADFATFRDR
jgi:nitroreductase